MKFKKSHIKSELIEEPNDINKISFKDTYPKDEWHPEYDVFCKAYENLINEWAKDLYTPYEFLQDIIRNIYNHPFDTLLRYRLDDVLDISTVDWSHYEKFKRAADKFDRRRFNFFILYYSTSWEAIERKLNYANFDQPTIQRIKRKLHFKAFCIANDNDIETGCIIVINGKLIDYHDTNLLEQELDHEMNHYFSMFDKENDKLKDLSLSKKIEKIGSDAGYDLSNEFVKQDFIDHILSRSEFKPMIANVCNVLQFKLNDDVDRYEWLIDCSTSSFLRSEEYRRLHQDLQNILLFTTICRAYSLKRWKEIIKSVKIQFDKNESLSEKMKCGFMTFIEKLKRWW